MKRDVSISVVTVHRNDTERLASTAESLQSQHCRTLEWIIKDAGSCASYPFAVQPPFMRWYSAPDRSLYDAMNQALALCTGDFVQFLNCGDTLSDAGVLSSVVAEITAAPDVDLFYGDVFDEYESHAVCYPSRLSRSYLFRRPLCHQAVFYRRTLLVDLGGYDLRYSICADNELLLRALRNRRIQTRKVDRLIVNYGAGGVSASLAGQKQGRREVAAIRRQNFRRWERMRFGAWVWITFPRLRMYLLARCPRLLRQCYRRVANLVNG